MTSTYTPTLMEKLLGKHYKWWYIILYTFKVKYNYIYSEVLTSIYRFSILLGVLILAKGTGANQDIFNYLIIGSMFYAITETFLCWDIGEKIFTGKIIRDLLTPQDFFKIYLFKSIAYCLYLFLGYLPWLVLIMFLFQGFFTISFQNIFILLLFITSSWLIRLFFDLFSGFTTFWTTDFTGMSYFSSNLVNLTSGSLFPLSFLPPFLYEITMFLPFSFTFYHPMQIYLGNYDLNQTLWVFVGGIAWCIVLYFLAKWVFKMGLKRNESVGL